MSNVRYCKTKGRNLQKLMRDEILSHFSDLTLNDVRSTAMGQAGVDIQLSEAAIRKFPYAIECKNVKKLTMSFWKQALDNSSDRQKPMLVFKPARKQMVICITEEEFFKLRLEGGLGLTIKFLPTFDLKHIDVDGWDINYIEIYNEPLIMLRQDRFFLMYEEALHE